MANLKWDDDDVICVEDFNFPSIKWTTSNTNKQNSTNFLETIDDLGWFQLINEPTRFRNGQQLLLLDLIMASKDNMVSSIKLGPPFGKSDHVCIEFTAKNPFMKNLKLMMGNYNIKNMDINKSTSIIALIKNINNILPECASRN